MVKSKKKSENTKIKDRDFGADLVRIYAVIMVLALHFFLRNGFYYREMKDFWGILVMTVRSVSLCCVPLFIMLTGYLKCGKEWTSSYYRSIVPIMISYYLISGLHLLYKIFYLGEERSAAEWLMQFLGFKLATYGWYVGMYIGLFLLTPLLNMVWTDCKSQKQHGGVVLTLYAVTFLPATVNTFIDSKINLLPAYFTQMYYIAYYFTGCYIKTYRPKIRQWKLWCSIFLIGAAISAANMYTRTDPANFYTGFSASYDHILTLILTICSFLSLYQVECKNIRVRALAAKISGIVFEIYLSSYLLDAIIFASFDRRNPTYAYFPAGCWMVAVVFAGSAVIALCVKGITDKITRF